MKNYGLGILTALCAICPALFAAPHPHPCEFSVTGEWVYLTPVMDDTYFVVDVDNFDSNLVLEGKREPNNMDYESGFRFGVAYGFENCVNDISASWTFLRAEDKRVIDRRANPGNQLLPTLGPANVTFPSTGPFFGVATSKLSIDLDRVDLLAGFCLHSNDFFQVHLEGGLQYSQLRRKLFVVYDAVVDTFVGDVKQTSRYWGVGPQLGVDLTYMLGCLSITGNVNGALLIGESSTSAFAFSDLAAVDRLLDVSNGDIWRMVPTAEARLGLRYPFCFCLDFSLEAGYTYLLYVRPLDYTVYQNITNFAGSFDQYSNLGFHGPYISLNASF